MRRAGIALRAGALAVAALAGCATGGGPGAPGAAPAGVQSCRPGEVEQLNARLEAEVAERQRLLRQAARREDALRRQLEAMKAIERGILDREERFRTETR